MSANVERMIAVRQPTWHGLEQLLPTAPTRSEAQPLAGHDYTVIREPLYRRILHPDMTETFEEYTPFELNVRSDNGLDLDVVPADRIEIQPQEVWDVAEWLLSNIKGLKIETAGTLNEGRNIWILLMKDEVISVRGDKHGETIPFFALQNGYTRDVAFRFQQLFTRIVCWNTSQMADVEAEKNNFNFSLQHTQNLFERIAEVKAAMLEWENEADAWREAKEYLATLSVKTEAINWFVDEFIPMPHVATTGERVKNNVEAARLELIGEMFSPRGEGLEGTALGLFEAASAWNEHVRAAQTPQTRFKRSILQRDTVLETARELALEAAEL